MFAPEVAASLVIAILTLSLLAWGMWDCKHRLEKVKGDCQKSIKDLKRDYERKIGELEDDIADCNKEYSELGEQLFQALVRIKELKDENRYT